MTQLSTLHFRNVSKQYPGEEQPLKVLDNVDLTVNPGEFISIVGTSGCGKSTLLRLILGLDDEYQGDILLDGRRITGTSVERGIVFQEHRLFPWLTVEKNIAVGLESVDISPARKRSLVQEHIDLVGLKGFEKAYPGQVSGGMAQRAAIARALVSKPEILLLDEPLGAIDALTRMYMQQELERIWQREGSTMIMVTHDIEEAIYLSDKVVVMSSRPGTVKKIVPVDLPRPRDRAGYEFSRLREQVLREFHLEAEHYFSYVI